MGIRQSEAVIKRRQARCPGEKSGKAARMATNAEDQNRSATHSAATATGGNGAEEEVFWFMTLDVSRTSGGVKQREREEAEGRGN
ncbi:hypothetical protein JCM14635_24020 [Megalodesulfovibrio paquesii]